MDIPEFIIDRLIVVAVFLALAAYCLILLSVLGGGI